ncbi:hypothetical protein Leryth_024929 [Lithospermum erythrorhizon]|nr:hypothetical protein Leryth_024929 [Lithospermum erythrorhizon]
MGWQGKDPSTDFRGGGFISLENLLYFARMFPKSFPGSSAENKKVIAIMGIILSLLLGVNITFMLIQMLDLESGLLSSVYFIFLENTNA